MDVVSTTLAVDSVVLDADSIPVTHPVSHPVSQTSDVIHADGTTVVGVDGDGNRS